MLLIVDALNVIRDIRSKGRAIGTWGGLLNLPQLVGGLIFIYTIEGQVILVTVILTLAVAGQIHKRARFSRIIGICHLPWIAMLPWLIWRIIDFEHFWLHSIWMHYVAATILISLVFDTMDIIRFFRGEKVFAWAR